MSILAIRDDSRHRNGIEAVRSLLQRSGRFLFKVIDAGSELVVVIERVFECHDLSRMTPPCVPSP